MDHCIFEYLYRDAGNYKAWGELLLIGTLTPADLIQLRQHFESGENFIAEQIGIPPLYEALWTECRTVPSEALDHAWHEFHDVRLANADETQSLECWGSAEELLKRVGQVESWNLGLSRNAAL